MSGLDFRYSELLHLFTKLKKIKKISKFSPWSINIKFFDSYVTVFLIRDTIPKEEQIFYPLYREYLEKLN